MHKKDTGKDFAYICHSTCLFNWHKSRCALPVIDQSFDQTGKTSCAPEDLQRHITSSPLRSFSAVLV